MRILIIALCLGWLPVGLAHAMQPKGFIQNEDGARCHYTQRVEKNIHYFSYELTGNVGVLVFDDPRCMSETALGQMVNINMINNVIVRWYAREPQHMMTREGELYPTSFKQVRGKCIQSSKHELLGVTVDYIERDGSIVEVRHGIAAAGCSK